MKVKLKNGETLNFLYSGVKGIYVLDHCAFNAAFDEDANNDWEKSSGKKKLQKWAEKNLPKRILGRFDVDIPTVEEVFSQKMLDLCKFAGRFVSKQFPIFQNSDNRMMEFNEKPFLWWTKSARVDYIDNAWCVGFSGGMGSNFVCDRWGFVPVLREKEENK